MTKYVILESDPALIKHSGDNCGYVYNPTGLIYTGESFNILPGEPIILIPHQPDNCGPWKQFRATFEKGQFLMCKEEETLTLLIENRFPNEVVKVHNGWSLAKILNHWGIQHEMTFVSAHHMEKIEAYELITLDDNHNDDDAGSTGGGGGGYDDNDVRIKKKKKKCHCKH
jgi:hypothetical protein